MVTIEDIRFQKNKLNGVASSHGVDSDYYFYQYMIFKAMSEGVEFADAIKIADDTLSATKAAILEAI